MAIDAYFKKCDGEILKDDGEPIFDKFGQLIINQRPYVTGLALALEFTSRLALLNYQGRKEFVNTVTCAKSYIEEYTESRLIEMTYREQNSA